MAAMPMRVIVLHVCLPALPRIEHLIWILGERLRVECKEDDALVNWRGEEEGGEFIERSSHGSSSKLLKIVRVQAITTIVGWIASLLGNSICSCSFFKATQTDGWLQEHQTSWKGRAFFFSFGEKKLLEKASEQSCASATYSSHHNQKKKMISDQSTSGTLSNFRQWMRLPTRPSFPICLSLHYRSSLQCPCCLKTI